MSIVPGRSLQPLRSWLCLLRKVHTLCCTSRDRSIIQPSPSRAAVQKFRSSFSREAHYPLLDPGITGVVVEDAVLHREREIATEYLDLVVGMISQRCWCACHYSNSLPDMFAGMFAPTAAQAAVAMGNVQELWSAIMKAVRVARVEDVAQASVTNALKQCLGDIYFKDHVFVKDTVVLLQRCDWSFEDPAVRQLVWGYVGCLANTKMPNENIFNTLRDIRRASKNKRVNRHRAWKVANTSNFFDFVEAETDDDDKFRHIALPPCDWEVPLDVNANAMKEGIFTIGGHKINSALDAHILLEADAKKLAQPWQPGGPTVDRRSSAAAALLRCTASNNFGHACTVWCFHVSVEVCASHLAVQPILIVDRSATPVQPQGRPTR